MGVTRVKSVPRGDALVLADKDENRSFQLSLAYVESPRLTEPWGFDAREYLRVLSIGKPVGYRLWYKVNDSDYGDISSPIFTSLIEHLLQKGWVKLRGDCDAKPGWNTYGDKLVAAQNAAKSAGLGIWSQKKAKPLRVRDSVPNDLYGSSRKVPAIVERVLSGDRVILRAMMDSDDHYVGLAMLAGVKAVRAQEDSAGAASGTSLEDAAAAALSARLLQQSQVRAIFHVASKSNPDIPLVTLQHPNGDIAALLLTNGLAHVINMPEIGAERLLQLRNAEMEGSAMGRGVHRAQAAARKEYAAKAPATMRVIKVLSSDTVVLEPGSRLVQLSSTRAPLRSENPKQSAEAREFARKLLIGQTVRVQVDGETVRPHSDPETRPVVTISMGPQFSRNAALEIIRAGWATATRHRRDDLARSPFYQELVQAETDAKAAARGIFAPPAKKQDVAVLDASESTLKARQFLGSLQRRGTTHAVIDHVFHAGRMRLSVPSENCSLIAVLDSVQVPREPDPIGAAATSYVMSEWNQRDVEITVRNVEKTNAFTTTISKKGTNLAKELLSRGFASVHVGSANASGLREAYDDLEEQAQRAHLGMWKNYESHESPEAGSTLEGLSLNESGTAATSGSPPYLDAVIASVDIHKLHIRLIADNELYQRMQLGLQTFFSAASNTGARSFTKGIRKGDTVVVQEGYERAKVVRVVHGPKAQGPSANTYELELIDTGATKTLGVSELLPMPEQFASTKPLARELTLRYVHRPVAIAEKKYLEYVRKFVNKPVVVIDDIVYTADSQNPGDSLNSRIVAGGYASVSVDQEREERAKHIMELQKKAMEQRLVMWEYGDIRDDSDLQ